MFNTFVPDTKPHVVFPRTVGLPAVNQKVHLPDKILPCHLIQISMPMSVNYVIFFSFCVISAHFRARPYTMFLFQPVLFTTASLQIYRLRNVHDLH